MQRFFTGRTSLRTIPLTTAATTKKEKLRLKPELEQIIRSRTNRKLKLLRNLRTGRAREKHGLFFVEGLKVVEELLKGRWGHPQELFLDAATPEERLAGLRTLLGTTNIRISFVSSEAMATVADTTSSQGILALARIPDIATDDLFSSSRVILLLDGVQDPGNVGTIIRMAEGMGADGVIALGGTCDPYSPKVVRATAGAIFHLPVYRSRQKEDVLKKIIVSDHLLTVLTPQGTPYWDMLDTLMSSRLVLVAGNEGMGVSPDIMEAADVSISIPMQGNVDSLNVAVSTGLILLRLREEFPR